MTQEKTQYRTLVVSSSDKLFESIKPVLTAEHCSPMTFTDNIASAKRLFLESQYDFVIINTPLKDEFGTKFAIDVSANKNAVCILFVKSENFEEINSKVTPYGVFTLIKPLASVSLIQALKFMAASRERLRALSKKTTSIEDKMEEIRIVNRAKWLLIECLKMTEPDAHRYIERKAMDGCVTKCEIAKEIIKTYS